MVPLVSVIIPTANRQHYLPRAIKSALEGLDEKDIEVLVVPNGPDDSWQISKNKYSNHPSVKFIKINKANANTARNTGLQNAKGQIIRFLDDDDYLVPQIAIKQYEILYGSELDAVSGSIQVIDSHGKFTDIYRQPHCDDFCSAVLAPNRTCLPHAHIYRRSKIINNKWDPSTVIRQDYQWIFDLIIEKDFKWHRIGDVVGFWNHHNDNRISTSKSYNKKWKSTAPLLLNVYSKLKKTQRLTPERNKAAIQGLWGCIHAAFYLEPSYWSKIAHKTLELDNKTRPFQPIYNYAVLRNINPLILQWILFPKRWLYHYIKKASNHKVRSHYKSEI